MKLSTNFWSGQAHQHKVDSGFFRSEYYNRVCALRVGQAVSYGKPGRVIKTDLWNESVATEREVLSLFQESYGVDISKFVCVKAHEHSSKVTVAQGDIRCLPFQAGSFSLVLDMSTIDHVPLEDACGVIAEYHRLLSEGGVLVLAYAQNTPFAALYWNKQFKGMYLLDRTQICQIVNHFFEVKKDCGIEFLHLVMGFAPFRLLEKAIWHVPTKVRNVFLDALFRFEASSLSFAVRDYAGLRLLIAVKQGEIK